MPRGRFVSRCIVRDRAVCNLSSDTAKLVFTWAIVFADVEGRFAADPDLVRAQLFPRNGGPSADEVDAILNELHNAKLIYRYEVDGESYACFPSFDKHQQGLRKEREADSDIPEPV